MGETTNRILTGKYKLNTFILSTDRVSALQLIVVEFILSHKLTAMAGRETMAHTSKSGSEMSLGFGYDVICSIHVAFFLKGSKTLIVKALLITLSRARVACDFRLPYNPARRRDARHQYRPPFKLVAVLHPVVCDFALHVRPGCVQRATALVNASH
jgi:hypothetical protein